jgi:hypothetical protein
MKIKLFALSLIAAFSLGNLSAQKDGKKMASPPAKLETSIGGAKVIVKYSQPSVKGREIFGGLVPFGKVWRTGANDATTISFSEDMKVNGKELKAGTYTLFTIPGEKEWTFIFNSELGQWGAYKYDEKKDVLKVTSKPIKHKMTEQMTFSSDRDNLYLDWAETRVALKIEPAVF